jgi:hypothetical protein
MYDQKVFSLQECNVKRWEGKGLRYATNNNKSSVGMGRRASCPSMSLYHLLQFLWDELTEKKVNDAAVCRMITYGRTVVVDKFEF